MPNKNKVVYAPEKSSAQLVKSIIFSIIKIIIEGIIAGICIIIPIIGWIISILCVISIIVEIVTTIIMIVGYSSFEFYLSEDGIYIKNSFMDTLVTFDKISQVYTKGSKIMIETKLPQKEGSNKNKIFQYAFAADPEEFCKQYQLQVQKVRSAQ